MRWDVVKGEFFAIPFVAMIKLRILQLTSPLRGKLQNVLLEYIYSIDYTTNTNDALLPQGRAEAHLMQELHIFQEVAPTLHVCHRLADRHWKAQVCNLQQQNRHFTISKFMP